MASDEKFFKQKLLIKRLRTFLVTTKNPFVAIRFPQIAKIALNESFVYGYAWKMSVKSYRPT